MQSQDVEVARSQAVVRPIWPSRDVVIGMLLALLPLLLFGAEAVGMRSFFYHDVQYYFFPYHKLVADVIHSGQLPLWNPFAFSGIPLLADGQTAMFYPPNWLFLIVPTAWALNLMILLQFSIAGVGMWVFARSLELRRGPALVGALSYMFNGFLVTRFVHLSIISGAALIPLLFWAVERLMQRPTRRRFVGAAVCVALQAVAGHPQVPVYTAFALGLYVLVQAAAGARAAGGRAAGLALLRLAGVYVAGYALAAIQLVPWFEFASLSPRAAGAAYDFVTHESIAPSDWWMWLFPYGWGGVQQNVFEAGPVNIGRAIYIWERAGYIGILPLVLAVVGGFSLFRGRRMSGLDGTDRVRSLFDPLRGRALLVVLVAAVLIATGHYSPVGRLVFLLPVMGKLRAYSRAIVLVSFAASILAAYGAQALVYGPPSLWRSARRTALLAVFVLGWLMAIALLLARRPELLPLLVPAEMRKHLDGGQANAWVPMALLIAATLAIMGARRRVGMGLLIGLVMIDLGVFAVSFNPTTEASVMSNVPESVQVLRRDQGLYRIASYISNDGLPPAVAQNELALSWSMAYGISNINGFNSLQPRRYTDVLFGPDVGDVSYGFLDDERLLQPGSSLLSLLNVKYVLQQPQSHAHPGPDWTPVYRDDTVTIWRNQHAWDRAFFVDQVRPATGREALDGLRANAFAPHQVALVEQIDAAVAAPLNHFSSSNSVVVQQPTVNSLVIRTSNEYKRLLVVSEPFMNGWQAEIDGQPATIYRTDYILRGVVVPAGTHTITFHYRPTSVAVGGSISGVAVLLLAGLAAWRRRRRAQVPVQA